MVAAAAVAVAAIGGIAAIQEWIPAWFSGDTPVGLASPGLRIAGTAPPESLSPGETIVTGAEKAPAASEAKKPLVAEKPPVGAPPLPPPPERKRCPNCGTVAALIYQPHDPRGLPWEVRVAFDNGSHQALRYPTNPGFRVGDRVILSNGRLQRS